ncbi:MAG: hypothetical protein CL608_16505 [Anaerolineaceae bacterium]|nr:hypothetical protein [Anaerolineaceae bacterium]
MKQRHLIFLLVLLTLLIACGEARPTPTPFADAAEPEETPDTAQPLAVSITELVADPEAYADSFIEITGQYRRLPLLVCDSDPHPAPATWELAAADGSVVAIGGFGSQVRSLLPSNLTMTVVGVWQLFEGPVGCGKSATTAEIWYLKARDIVSPSPIARVTLTPTGSGTQIADVDEDTAVATPTDNNLTPTLTPTRPEGDDGEPVGTPTLASTTVPAPPGDGTSTSTPTREDEAGEPTFTPSPTREGDTGTGTPTSPPNGAATPTASSGSGTPTPTSANGGNPTPTTGALATTTRNPSDFDTVEFDPLGPEQPILELLEAEQAHLYPVIFDYNGAITITAVAEPTMNIVLEIIGPTSDVVQQANNTGNGGLESIVNAQLNTALDYKIRIYNLNDNEGDYCLVFSEGGGFPDTIKGRIEYGQTINNRIEVLGIDYWCFLGTADDNVSISSAATGAEGDFVVGLFGPPDFDSIGTVFQDGTIMNVSLTENGMYMIGVLDFEAGAAGYTLTLTKN